MKLTEVACSIVAEEEGTEHVFGLMGDGNISLITHLTGMLGLPFHSARHESGAIGMADGYARASGKVGVCTVTQGPGLTNAMTALVTAQRARSPLVLLAGDLGDAAPDHPQHIDQAALLAAAGFPVVQAADGKTIHDDIRRAFRSARELAAPIVVNFPLPAQERQWVPWDVDVERREATAQPPDVADRDAVSRAAALLAEARRPVIVAGRGALAAGVELRALGEHVGALLATTLPAKGLFADDPFDIGIAGSLGTSMARSLIGRADVILAIGASLNDFTTLKGTLFGEAATVIRCDLSDDPAAERRRVSCSLRGDATAVTRQLLAAIAELGGTREGFRTPDIKRQLRSFSPRDEYADMSDADTMDPRSLVLALDAALPQDRQVVTDAGHFFGFPCAYLSIPEGGRLFPTIDFGAVGSGLGIALGAATARPDLTTILFIGDGGLLMSLPELGTLAGLGPRMVVVVMNDRAYGAELHMLRRRNLPTAAAELDRTPFEDLGKAFGIPSMTVRAISGVGTIREHLSNAPGPLLVDCRITRKVVGPWLEGAIQR